MYLAFCWAIYAFLLLETLRQILFQEVDLVASFHRCLTRFTDERDSDHLIATHIYLLIGCAFPFLMNDSFPLSGLIILGVGDSFAAIIGKSLGRHKITLWPCNKTYEGLLACIVSTLVCTSYFSALAPSVVGCVVAISLLAYT